MSADPGLLAGFLNQPQRRREEEARQAERQQALQLQEQRVQQDKVKKFLNFAGEGKVNIEKSIGFFAKDGIDEPTLRMGIEINKAARKNIQQAEQQAKREGREPQLGRLATLGAAGAPAPQAFQTGVAQLQQLPDQERALANQQLGEMIGVEQLRGGAALPEQTGRLGQTARELQLRQQFATTAPQTAKQQLAEQVAQIGLKIGQGGAVTPEEQAQVDFFRSIDPITALTRKILSGQGGLDIPGTPSLGTGRISPKDAATRRAAEARAKQAPELQGRKWRVMSPRTPAEKAFVASGGLVLDVDGERMLWD